MSFASISNLRTYSTQLAMPGTSVIVLLKDKMGSVGTQALEKFDKAISNSKRTVQVRKVVGQVASASYAKISSIAGQAILRLDRSASSMGNVAKFFNLVFSTSNFAVKMFEGSHFAHLSGNFLKVKDINDLVSAFNAFDLISEIGKTCQEAWKIGGIKLYRLAQKVLLFAGSSLAPISLASKKMDLFKLGYYGENIGIVGKMPRLDFFKNAFILTASVMSLADKTFYPTTDAIDAEIAKLKMDQWNALLDWSNGTKDVYQAETAYDYIVEELKTKNVQVLDLDEFFDNHVKVENDGVQTFIALDDDSKEIIKAQAKLHRKLYEEKSLTLEKSVVGYKDDLFKIAAISAVLAAAYVLPGLTDYPAFALVTLATGYYGAEKADIDTRAKQLKEDIKTFNKKHAAVLAKTLA